MGLEGTLQRLQSIQLSSSHESKSSCRQPVCQKSPLLSPFRSAKNHRSLGFSFCRQSTLFTSCRDLNYSGLTRSFSDDSYHFNEEILGQIEDFKHKFDAFDEIDDVNASDSAFAVSKIDNEIENDAKDVEKIDSEVSFLPSKFEFLEPSFLGISPEDPPHWSRKEEIEKMQMEFEANTFEFDVSLPLKWQQDGDFAYCNSMNKAFSSMVFMIEELQDYALSTRDRFRSEDLQAVVDKFHKETNASFVWLFLQVFSQTPNLMVCVMLLLADFTAYSVAGTHYRLILALDLIPTVESLCKESISIPYPTVLNTREYQEMIEEDGELVDPIPVSYTVPSLPGSQEMNEDDEEPEESILVLYPTVSSPPGYQEVAEEEEVDLWNRVVKEASLLQEEESKYTVLDQETMNRLVSDVSVEVEPDDYVEIHRTDLIYQMGVAEDPNSILLLSNYAHFLYKVRGDYDRAEECFKRAIRSGQADAETYSRYAEFLWLARNDLWSAEEVYQKATDAAPNDHYYIARYANFLWSTGNGETCFPLDASFS